MRVEALDFEGPLDLLVYLVQKNEVDVYDIPIALITAQFLEYLESMRPERLESAGDFLLMAATLLRIKAQMLLPRPEPDDDVVVEDPRRELVMMILEYQQFREIADQLKDREAVQRDVYGRADPGAELAGLGAGDDVKDGGGRRATLGDLVRAFARVMEETARERVHRLEPIGVTIEEKVRFIRGRLRREGRTSFRELFVAGEPRSHWIVTFVALLEMAREGEIRLRQGDRFGEIHVYAGELRDDG
ncbi:MAG TPA: segregation/condensation protein A [Gemmatimonadota bacterium]|nr:segregation/condensation protein A [Gemmatimonadota bacterium]